jgi:cytochrome P450
MSQTRTEATTATAAGDAATDGTTAGDGPRREQGGEALTGADMVARYGRDMFNDFDIEDATFNERFIEVMDDLVAGCPMARSNVGHGYWMVTGHQDVRRVAQDWKTFSSAKGFQPNRPEGVPFLYPEESDPPIHTAWRRALNPYLSPKAVAAFEEPIRQDCNTLIDQFIGRRECEFTTAYGTKVPGWAFFKNLIGVPPDDAPALIQGYEDYTFSENEQERSKGMARVFDYLGQYLAIRKEQSPRGDIVDRIARGVTYEDGNDTPSSWDDQVCVLVDIGFGGLGTTTMVLAAGVHHLATHPEDRRLLAENPDLMPGAVEEFVRVFPPVVALARTCTRDVEVAGTKMKKGDWLLVGYGTASRDPRAVDEPKKIDITRETVLHSNFGLGPHRCIGSHLARLEIEVAFAEWMKRIPEFELKAGTAPKTFTSTLRNMKDVHLVF